MKHFEMPALFPLSDLQTEGYAQPKSRDEHLVEETEQDEIEDAA